MICKKHKIEMQPARYNGTGRKGGDPLPIYRCPQCIAEHTAALQKARQRYINLRLKGNKNALGKGEGTGREAATRPLRRRTP